MEWQNGWTAPHNREFIARWRDGTVKILRSVWWDGYAVMSDPAEWCDIPAPKRSAEYKAALDAMIDMAADGHKMPEKL